MILYNLDSYQILTLTYILMLALSAIFVIFIPRNLPEKITVFRKRLNEYKKKKVEELLIKLPVGIEDIKAIRDDPEKHEIFLESAINISDGWSLKIEAINRLLIKETEIHKIGKFVLFSIATVFVSGIFSNIAPGDFIVGEFSRIDLTQILFIVEIFLVLYWIWIIFNFVVMLKAQSEELRGIEEL